MSSGERGVENIEPSGAAAEEDQVAYSVEMILDKRLNNNKVEYFLKWNGYDDRENSWEPEENLDCVDLIKAFEEALIREEKERKRQERKEKRRQLYSLQNTLTKPIIRGRASPDSFGSPAVIQLDKKDIDQANIKVTNVSEVTEKIPDEILGATDSSGQLMFLMKWKGTDESDLISAVEANILCPQVVIDFYEKKLTWNSSSGNVNFDQLL
ncbi:chromobox protein homolog 1-like [Metopolophium dirhodum]|uniref:chromobox protein homolog 1-like n=1 Tax=Metopolophium dirhodum TaxID=44670 RepID=UPI00298F3F94|nr:chromobox protein homolog 1-like [Metopolophium dirhodum]